MLGLFKDINMQNNYLLYPKAFIIEFAAIVFLVITIPVWLPLVLSILAGSLGIMIFVLIIGLIISSVAKSDIFFTEFYIILANSEIIYL